MSQIDEDLARNLSRGLLDFCSAKAEEGITDLQFHEGGRVDVRRGPGNTTENADTAPSRHLLLAIVELALGKSAADDLARGGSTVSGSIANYRISASAMPDHGPIILVLRLQ